jgi:tetratricopeptide (TPR) repeat protein
VEQHLRLVAWEALGLDTDAAKEADSVGMEAGRSALIEKRITDAEARKAKLEAGSHPVPASLLLELGQRQQALRVADTDLHEQQDLLQKALAAKAKCKTCTSLADPFVTSAAQARLTRATALYANGRQEEAIAEIQAQIKAEGQNRALVQTQEALKSVSPAKPAKYETDQAYNMLAAIKALAGDWDGCLKALGELSDEDFNSPRHQSVIWKGCRWMKATDPGSADKPPASNQLSAIRGEIETVVRSGKYRSLPEPRVIADSTASGPASITIKNSSRYNLTVLCAGPAECSTQVAAGQTAEVRLPAGSYQMLGRVDMPSAQPLYEQYAFESGFVYNFDFSMAMQ